MNSELTKYIATQSEATATKLKELRSIILEAAPKATETFNYNIPAFALVPDGKRDQQIMMAGYKQHVGLYPHPSVIEKFAKELQPYKYAKGSVQFQLDQPLPKDLIKKMITYRLALLEKTGK